MNEAYYDRSTLDDEADKLTKVQAPVRQVWEFGVLTLCDLPPTHLPQVVTTLEQELTGCVQDTQRLGVVINKAHDMERSLAQEICKEEVL